VSRIGIPLFAPAYLISGVLVVCVVDTRPFALATHALAFSERHSSHSEPITDYSIRTVEVKEFSIDAILEPFAHRKYAKREEHQKKNRLAPVGMILLMLSSRYTSTY